MISPSNRQRKGRAQRLKDPLGLHVREAKALRTQVRLLRAAGLAAALAAVSLFFPLGHLLRAALILAAAAVAGAWPTRKHEGEALAEIREQLGMGYETALGIAGDPDSQSEDEYGFGAEVVRRAKDSVRSFEPPKRPAWWLPLAVAALALYLVPSLLPARASPSAGGQVAAGQEGDTAADRPDPQEEETPPEAPLPDLPDRVGGDAFGTAPPASTEAPTTQDLMDGDRVSKATLEEYVRALEGTANLGEVSTPPDDEVAEPPAEEDQAEREAGGRGPGVPGDGSPEGARERGSTGGGAGVGDSDGEDGSPDGSDDASDDRSGGQGSGGEEGASETREDDAGEGGGAGEEPGAEGGQDDGEGDDQEGGPQAGGTDGGGEADLERGDEEPGAGGAGSTRDADGEATEGEEGGAGTDAGVGGADPRGARAPMPDLGGGEESHLFGLPTDGPETVTGAVRLPGSRAVELPAGTPTAPYSRAAEEAVNSEELPVEYLEILRRYYQ